MLEYIRTDHPSYRSELLKNFDPQSTSWIVSDLRAKFEIQNYLLEKNGYFENLAVLRASELWKTIILRHFPHIKLISRDFVRVWIKQQMKSEGPSHEVVLDFLDIFSQVFYHPEGHEQLTDWLKRNAGASDRWAKWYQMAWQMSQEIQSAQQLTQKWAASFLSSQTQWEQHWQRTLIFDLGGDLTMVEAELIQALARSCSVKLIVPEIDLDDDFQFLLRPYEVLSAYGQHSSLPKKNGNKKKVQLKKFTGPLAEIKFVTSEIHRLIDQGVSPQKIAVLAPDIEIYWPMLELFFAEEGITCAKDQVLRVHSLPAVSWWLSRLRLYNQSSEYSDLETGAFQIDQNLSVRFEKFQALYRNMLDFSDIERVEKIARHFFSAQQKGDLLSVDQFTAIICRFWPSHVELDNLVLIAKELAESSNDKIQLNFENWLLLLEQLTTRMEIKIQEGSRHGVQVLQLRSADSEQFEYRFFLNLSEQAFEPQGMSLLSPAEIEKIYSDLGFHTTHPDQSSLNFELFWLQKFHSHSDYLCFPMTNYSGAEQSPHPFWTKMSQNQSLEVSIPAPTRLDYIQSLDLAQMARVRSYSQEKLQLLNDQIKIDRGEKVFESWQTVPLKSLSPSALEAYHRCPFIFAAQRVFRLIDPAQADVDTDHRAKGLIVHRLFELLVKGQPQSFSYTEIEVQGLLNQIYQELYEKTKQDLEYLGDTRLWPPLRNQLTQLGLRFLHFESAYQSQGHRPIATEHKFEFKHHDFQWRGSIDRIDTQVGGELIVYDYKARDRGYGAQQWFDDGHLQLAFYFWAIYRGFISVEGARSKVNGALYYVYRNFTQRGFDPTVDVQKIETFLQQFEEKLEKFYANLSQGKFAPEPLDPETTCSYCQWSRLCRAQHLNI